MKKIITIEIDETGETSVDLNGFHGKGCQAVIDAFRAGDTVKSTRTKPEYSIEQKQQHVQKQGG